MPKLEQVRDPGDGHRIEQVRAPRTRIRLIGADEGERRERVGEQNPEPGLRELLLRRDVEQLERVRRRLVDSPDEIRGRIGEGGAGGVILGGRSGGAAAGGGGGRDGELDPLDGVAADDGDLRPDQPHGLSDGRPGVAQRLKPYRTAVAAAASGGGGVSSPGGRSCGEWR